MKALVSILGIMAVLAAAPAVAQMKGILAAANVEHRDLPLAHLVEDWNVLDEDRVDDFLKRLRERLKDEFEHYVREGHSKVPMADWRPRELTPAH